MISAIQAICFVLIGNSIMEIKGMYWQYWLVLFSAWTMSNLIGLVISDSFKTVVTIYILIPFLVIPQIILSGIIVKYEKLNPIVSSPESIPWYGEIITARWAYEGLMVYQFMENDYESQFYSFDKIKSISNFKKYYWYNNLKNKALSLSRNLNIPDKKEQNENDLLTLRNEIARERKVLKAVPFEHLDHLYPDKVNMEVLDAVKLYLDRIKTYHIQLYNKADAKKDKLITRLQKEDKAAYLRSTRAYQNDQLTDFVKNESVKNKPIVEYNGRLIQKLDPIFLDPEGKFIKAHFYAPRKKLFGEFYPTIWINILVLWAMSFILYFILYFRLFKKFLDWSGSLTDRLFPESEQ